MEKLRLVRILTIAGVAVVAVMAAVLLALSGGWDDPDTSLANIGLAVTTAIGLAGVGMAIAWRNRVTASPQSADGFFTSFVIVSAVTESALLIGFVFAIAAQQLTPFWVGAAMFVVGLAVAASASSQVDLET